MDVNAIGPGSPVVIIMTTGMKKLGTWVSSDSDFLTIDFRGERQLIPLKAIDTVKSQ